MYVARSRMAFRRRSPSGASRVPHGTQLPVVARYLEGGILASGWLVGEKVIANRAAVIDAPLGRGRVILFGMRSQYRAQSYLTFKMFFNALLYQ
jgi:hypothetical protein